MRNSRPELLSQIQNNKLARISARETLSSIRKQFPEAPLTLRDIENIYNKFKQTLNRGLPAIQAMISKLGDEYQFQYVLDDHERLERVLFFHNASLQLLRLFPKSYVLDATYKTNRFNLPLLDIVGFTATNRSFIIGQAFLTHEQEEDYIWVLQWIRDIYKKYELPIPESITTDKAGGLHNACSVVWPEVPHLLCRWHIDKDVRAYCQKEWLEITDRNISNEARKAIINERVNEFLRVWSQLLYATTETEYDRVWSILQRQFRHSQPRILNYLTRTWLPFKETFIRAWTDKIRHYGNVDSSRAEGVHQAIKRQMGSQRIHLNDVVDHLSMYLDLHNKQLREELEYGQQKERTDLQNPLYRKLHGHISYYAIDQQRMIKHLPLEIADFDIQWRIDRLGELAELPLIRRITDPLTVSTRYTKSQKRQLSLFEVIQGQVDALVTASSKRGHRRTKAPSQQRRRPPLKVVTLNSAEKSSLGNSQQPIDIDDIAVSETQEENINSDDDPLGAELQRQRQQPSRRGIQIQGWIEYQAPHSQAANSLQKKRTTPSPLYPPLPLLRTPSPFADLDLPLWPSPTPVPSTPSPLRRASTTSPLSPADEAIPPPQVVVSPMTSPAKKRPRREIQRPQRYRD
ncbi:hypothetical protein EPUS_09311 [Endocarpon pusillum Z07020]|uniref:MULE transposase domain-containing protein n=1 Tax=Endocarpon pusillum (strain Z07020 / HMAS-L-300199) TaxID=1263415 RepID=U1GCF7_ENDPU|nr:uncharacterized protein EPUS_09311 [Endocarpon pusillum Z07020]ERF69733.1 hypothetical protein EPUS_09311 [Endocarpon pusillum Z07020]